MELLKKRAANLLTVKSILTLSATAVFCIRSLRGEISGQEFLTVYSVITAFYFGTQAKKNELGGDGV